MSCLSLVSRLQEINRVHKDPWFVLYCVSSAASLQAVFLVAGFVVSSSALE
jgi:hypothetical protein